MEIEEPNKIIELDWYKDYGIHVIPSLKSGEAYSTLGDFQIYKDWGRGTKKKDGYKILYHETFAFIFPHGISEEGISKKSIKRFIENIEKVYLLQHLGAKDVPSVGAFIKYEGAEYLAITHELFEDFADENFDLMLKGKTEKKDIYYFQRVKWTINNNKIRARFSFLVLDNKE